MSRRAREHASRLVAQLDPDERDCLAEDPLVGLDLLGIRVRLRPASGIEGDCTVSGSYDAGPPEVITVVESRSIPRQFFTALHELGHRLSATDPDLHDAFDEESDGGRRLEEDVCDAVAAELLLPDARVDAYIGERGPTARGVLELFDNTNASREACCVRAAQRLVGAGHVMLFRDGVARFTASAGTSFRVRRMTPQPEEHPLRRAGRSSYQGEAPVRYASGGLSDRFFFDAVGDDDGYVFAVFTDSKPAWVKGLAIMNPGDVTSTGEAFCPWCDTDFDGFGAPCPKCQGYTHRVPWCGKCSCEPERTPGEKQCTRCWVVRPPAEWSLGGAECDICGGA